MCVINLTLNTTTPNGTSITAANGRYRLENTTNWIVFQINLNDPKTPNIIDLGTYELQVNVVNSANVTSEWSTSSFFDVKEICGTVTQPPAEEPPAEEPPTEPTGTTQTVYSYLLGYSTTSLQAACSDINYVTFWGNTPDFANATQLYQNAGGTYTASGYYANYNVARQWSASGFFYGSGEFCNL